MDEKTIMKVTVIQMNSQANKLHNLATAEKLILAAIKKDNPDLIALPEMFSHMGGTIKEKIQAAESFSTANEKRNPAYSLMRMLAKKHRVFIHAGSMIEKVGGEYFNASVVFNSEGKKVAHYRKINLFRANMQDGSTYDESQFFSAGKKISIYLIHDIPVGAAVCFDLRFSPLFNSLIKKQVKMIVVPSAFTYLTGKAHWELLCRTRAIETQSFIIAPSQTGNYTEDGVNKQSWGHSLVVDPWGNILVKAEEECGFFTAQLDFEFLEEVRRRLPVASQLANKPT